MSLRATSRMRASSTRPGQFPDFKAGKAHGPQTTKNGCRLLVLWTERSSKESADLSDFTLANQRAA